MASSYAESLTLAFREHARIKVVELLDSRQGKKLLVLDAHVSTLLRLAVDTAVLKEHGAEQAQILDRGMAVARLDSYSSIVYILRPSAEACSIMIEHVKACAAVQPAMHFTAAFVPRRSMVCDQMLSTAGLSRDVTAAALALEAAPLEPDLWTMEAEGALREALGASVGPLHQAARAVRAMERAAEAAGPIPLCQGFGPSAFRTLQILQDLGDRGEEAKGFTATGPGFSRLVLMDREMDWWSVLSTQLTYEGLIDELLGIQAGSVVLPGKEEAGPGSAKDGDAGSSASGGARTVLNSSDRLFAFLRDLPFGRIGPALRERAVEIQQGYQQLQGKDPTAAAVSVTGMRDFVRKLGSLPELQRHTDLAHALAGLIREPSFVARMAVEQELVAGGEKGLLGLEELVADARAPLPVLLRLLCLASQTLGAGLSRKQLEPIVRELVHGHGGHTAAMLHQLQRMGLLRRADLAGPSAGNGPGGGTGARPTQSTPFNTVRRAFNLTPDLAAAPSQPAGPPPDEMSDISYVFAGFAPLSIRLVEMAMKSSRALSEAPDQIKALSISPRVLAAAYASPAPSPSEPSPSGQRSSPLDALGLHASCAPHVALIGAGMAADASPLVRWFELRRTVDSEGRPVLRPPPLDLREAKGRGWRAAEILGSLGRTWLGYGAARGGAADGDADLWGNEGGADDEAEEGIAASASAIAGPSSSARESVLLVFLGGITFAEVAAVRSLSARLPIDFVILTTGVINGNGVMRQLLNLGPGGARGEEA